MKAVYLALFIFLLVPLSSAEVLWNKTYTTSNTVEVGAHDYVLKVGSGNITSIMLSEGNDSLFVKEGK